MIRNDREYQQTVQRIRDFEEQADAMRQKLLRDGFGEGDIETALSGTSAILEDLRFERDYYERLLNEGPSAVPDYPPEERGKALIALRIALRKSQKQLAEALGVSEAQISRDEKNDYHGITLERYARILNAMGIEEHVASYVDKRSVAV
jgi:DNA-binding XRE family transcriptional regulator